MGIIAGIVPIHKLNRRRLWVISASSLPVTIVLVGVIHQAPGWWSTIPYVTFVGAFWILVNYSNYSFKKHVSSSNISALTSLSSSVSRIASVVTLLAASALLNHVGPNALVCIFFIASAMLVVTVMGVFRILQPPTSAQKI